jgi:hypothetical protein
LSRSSIHLFYSFKKWEIQRLSRDAVAKVAARARDTLPAYKLDAGRRIYFSVAVKSGPLELISAQGSNACLPGHGRFSGK